MHISLTPLLEETVQAKVASGLYNNASEVIREALRLMIERENENQWLKREAAIGFAQLDIAEFTEITSAAELLILAKGK